MEDGEDRDPLWFKYIVDRVRKPPEDHLANASAHRRSEFGGALNGPNPARTTLPNSNPAPGAGTRTTRWPQGRTGTMCHQQGSGDLRTRQGV